MSRRPKLLIVDDNDRYVELGHALMRQYDYATRCELPGPCWTCAQRRGCTLTHAHDLTEARESLLRHPDIDAVLLDLAFDLPEPRLAPSAEQSLERRRSFQGLDILRAIREISPTLPIVLMTERSALDFADAADALAADEYLALAGRDAFDATALSLLVERAVARRDSTDVHSRFVWGSAPAMGRLRHDAINLARTSLPLLLLGETGTGKTRMAEDVLHPATGRSGPFVAVDLAAMPPDLVASELFGSARGAFSGAVDRPGALESADGGTLFIDEIGNLPAGAQRVLLVALERGSVTRLGETRARLIDVKVLAATNADLDAAVRQGTFRADLLARLNPSVRIELPPLRARRDDLPMLVDTFARRAFDRDRDRALLTRYAQLSGCASVDVELEIASAKPDAAETSGRLRFVFDRQTFRELQTHDWPGNLRELRHVIATVVLLTLADAMAVAERGAAPGHRLPVSRKLVRDLLRPSSGRVGTEKSVLLPQKRLHDVAQLLERRHYEELYRASDGDFSRMAMRLLGKGSPAHARKVQLRYNQLGLRVRTRINNS